MENLQGKNLIEMGVKPFERVVVPYYNSLSNEVCLEFSKLIANTTIGVLPLEVYANPTDKTEVSFKLFEYHLMVVLRAFLKNQENIKTTLIYASPKFLEDDAKKISSIIDSLLEKYDCKKYAPNICLAFDGKVLWEDKNLLKVIKTIKKLGVKVAVLNVGDRFCPITILSELSCDYASLVKENFINLDMESSRKSLIAIVEYLKFFNTKVLGYVDDVENDRALLSKCGVYAFVNDAISEEELKVSIYE